MADVKISQLPAATTPLSGSEEVPLVQSGVTKKATVASLSVSQTLQTITNNGATTTNNSTFNGANIGTYSGVPAVTTVGSIIGLANSTYAVGLSGSAWVGTSNNSINLGSVGLNWNNVYATNYNVGSGTATIASSGNSLILNSVASAVPGAGFSPVVDNSYYLGGASLKWKGLYLSDGNISWNSYAIPAPAGGTTTFLRNDGTWAVPPGSGGGTGTVTSVGSGTGLTGGPITTSGSLAINYAYGGTWTANQNFNGASIGTFSTVPGVSSGSGTKMTLTNSTNQLVLDAADLYGFTDASTNLGNATYRWNNLYLKNSFFWNAYTISAPAGSTTTFLRNDGTWATPPGSGGSGTVTSVSVVTANGFAGTVATATTTPAITLTTSITGVLKGNGTAISAATAGTDYLIPGGALGTPSSGTLTNATGLSLTTGVTGVLPVVNGGTGTATPALVAGTNVTITGTWPNQTINSTGGGGSGTVTSINVSGGTTGLTATGGPITTSGTITLGGLLAIANGGTNGSATPTAGAVSYGTGTAFAFTTAGTSGYVLQSNGASAPTWRTPTEYATVTDDTTTAAVRYPLFSSSTSGNLTAEFVSSTKLKYTPSTGALTASQFIIAP